MALSWQEKRRKLPTQQGWILKNDKKRLEVLGRREHRTYRQQLTAVLDFYCHERGLDMDTARRPGEAEPEPESKTPDDEPEDGS